MAMVNSSADRAEKAVTRLLWERRFERAALAILVLLYVAGFHAQQQTDDKITSNRVNVSDKVCRAINANAQQANRNGDYIRGLIVNGAKASRPFEPLYKQYGFPSYRQRVREALTTAEKLDELRVPLLDCHRFAGQIKAANR